MPDQTPEPLTAAELDEIIELGELLSDRTIGALVASVEDARSWARHGYEIGQRSCTWSDQGVAPAWLTEGHAPESLEPTEDQRRMFGLDEENARLRARITELEAAQSEPHAYIVVKRTRRPEEGSPGWKWLHEAAVISVDQCEYWAEHGYDLVPIVGSETGTRPAAQSAPAANIDDDRCPGRCVTGADLGVSPENGGWMIANVDPECPVHGEPQSDPVGYAVVSELRDGTLAVLPSGVMSKSVAVARAAAYRAEGGYSDARVYELREVQQ